MSTLNDLLFFLTTAEEPPPAGVQLYIMGSPPEMLEFGTPASGGKEEEGHA
jgi:hypothetical protein